MHRSIRFRAFVLFLTALLELVTSPDAGSSERDDLGRVIPHKAVWSAPPQRTPANSAVDGPLMGNGDLGVCLAGPPQALRFHLAKNDFWRLKSKYGQGGPRPFGYLDLSIEALQGASYQVEQSVADGVVTGTFSTDGLTVKVVSWVAATENMFVVEISSEGKQVGVRVVLSPAIGNGSVTNSGGAKDNYWAQRTFETEVDIPTQVAAAMKVIGAEDAALTLKPGQTVTIATSMASRFQQKKPLAFVKQRQAKVQASTITQLRSAHASWWKQYWQQSGIEIEDPQLEQAYYQGLYTIGACSRDPKFPPGLYGTWVTTDSPGWSGDYHLNYNHFAPFYALYAANRVEQGDPQDAPLLDFRERGRWYATNVTQTRGVLYPVGIGPLGIETTRDANRYRKTGGSLQGGTFLHQKSDAAFSLVNIAERWRCTYDPAYAKKVYPFVKVVVEFWEDYLKLEDDRYVIRGDAIHEGTGKNVNPILTLGLVRNAFDLALDMSRELNIDRDRRNKWQQILSHLSDWPTQVADGKTMFRYTEVGNHWWRDNTVGIQHIYPANAIGLDSDPKWIDVARNTLGHMNRWFDVNGSNSFFPAAVRIGCDPQVILTNLRSYAQRTYPNGYQRGNPHGIENCSTVPNTINMMLCMGSVPVGDVDRTESVLRLFAVWPREQDARFEKLRTWGAFLVSSALENGEVQFVKIHSERGRLCTIVNPWPGKLVHVTCKGETAEVVSGDRFSIKTTAGQTFELSLRE